MAQFCPLTLDRLTEPHYAGGTGYVKRTDGKKSETRYLQRLQVQDGNDFFRVTWELHYGHDIQADQTFQSNPDGSFRIKEKLVALNNIETEEIATGLIALLNNIGWLYEDGKRLITVNERPHEMIAGAQTDFHETGVRRINIDGVIQISSVRPIDIFYRGARQIWKARRIDELYLNYLSGHRRWRKNQVISEYDVTMRCVNPPTETGK